MLKVFSPLALVSWLGRNILAGVYILVLLASATLAEQKLEKCVHSVGLAWVRAIG